MSYLQEQPYDIKKYSNNAQKGQIFNFLFGTKQGGG